MIDINSSFGIAGSFLKDVRDYISDMEKTQSDNFTAQQIMNYQAFIKQEIKDFSTHTCNKIAVSVPEGQATEAEEGHIQLHHATLNGITAEFDQYGHFIRLIGKIPDLTDMDSDVNDYPAEKHQLLRAAKAGFSGMSGGDIGRIQVKVNNGHHMRTSSIIANMMKLKSMFDKGVENFNIKEFQVIFTQTDVSKAANELQKIEDDLVKI